MTVPASNFAATASTLTTSYSTRNGLWNPRFGTRRWSGIWPPSKPRLNLNPERDFAPLCPRPAVLPLPDPCPRPMRFFACLAPRGGLRFSRPIVVTSLVLNRHQVTHLVNQPARFRRVLQLHRVTNAAQTHAAHDVALVALEADWALHERHLDGALALCVRSLVRHVRFRPVDPDVFRCYAVRP